MQLKILLIFIQAGYIFRGTESCRNGWVQRNDKCYMFSRLQFDWAAASSICQAYHAKLAEPQTREEAQFLTSHAQKLGGEFWLGISDIIEENVWVYSSTLRKTPFTFWGPNEPNGGLAEGCVALWSHVHEQWIDVDCKNEYKLICEMDNEIPVDIVG